MALSAHAYPKLQQEFATKLVNLATDSLKVMLLASYTPAITHATMADVLGAATEASGTGYTAGGQALTSVSVSTTGSVTTLTCASPSWTPSTLTATYAVFYDAAGGTNATNYPLVYWDFGVAQSSASGPFTININTAGLYQVTSTF